jgi:hypothetical protein
MAGNYLYTDGALIMDDYRAWTFPKDVSIEKVSEYDEQIKQIKAGEIVSFDLRDTVKIHSSFIGFLIHAKHHINKNGGKLELLLSSSIEKILIMLNIMDLFSPDIISSIQKTA